MGLLTTAGARYLKRGWAVIPVNRMTKRPLIKWRWAQKKSPTERDLARWEEQWPDLGGVAVVCGSISGGLVVVDLDGREAIKEALALGIANAPFATTPRGGRHYFFTSKEKLPNAAKLGESKKIDIRAEGGYVVAAPTVNGVGAYTWRRGNEKSALPELPAWVLKMVRAIGQAQGAGSASAANPCGCLIATDEDAILESVPPYIRGLIEHGHSFDRTLPSRSEGDFIVVRELLRIGLVMDVIEMIFAKFKIGAKYREKGRRYLETTAQKAVQTIDTYRNRVGVFVQYADLTEMDRGRRLFLRLGTLDNGRSIRCGVTIPKPGESSPRFEALFKAVGIPTPSFDEVEAACARLRYRKMVVELDETRGLTNPVTLFLPHQRVTASTSMDE